MIGLAEPRTAPGPSHRRRNSWLAAGVVVVLLGVAAWVIGFSSALGVGTVSVTDSGKYLHAAQIRQAAAIRPGTPLIRLDTRAIRDRIRQLPAVRDATVTTKYPSTVLIAVTERVAVGHRATGGVDWLVDSDGVAFQRISATPSGIPSLTETGDTELDNQIATVAAALAKPVAKKVANITASTPESITLTMTDGRSVLWGGTDRDRDKAALLPALLTQPGRYFDISDPDTVISRGGN